jgi:hypothetical protein
MYVTELRKVIPLIRRRIIPTAEQLAGLAELTLHGYNFSNKTVGNNPHKR